jgi:hypothetical protein
MALTSTEEALVRQLLDQQAAILSLAGNESTITSKLGATKVTLSDLSSAASVTGGDLFLTRQGTSDKSVIASVLASYILNDPTLTGDPKAPTAAQFDNDTSIANTAFVKRALGSFSGLSTVAASRNLTVNDIGKTVWFSGAFTLTLPTPASLGLPEGAAFTAYATGAAGTVAIGAGASLDTHTAPISIERGNGMTFFAASGTQWGAFGTASVGTVGYSTGTGGTVTQATSKSTAVTLNKLTGQITMHNAALAAGAIVEFTFSNSFISASDCIVFNQTNGGSTRYIIGTRTVSTGFCTVNVTNPSGGSLSEAIVINFAVIKGATS